MLPVVLIAAAVGAAGLFAFSRSAARRPPPPPAPAGSTRPAGAGAPPGTVGSGGTKGTTNDTAPHAPVHDDAADAAKAVKQGVGYAKEAASIASGKGLDFGSIGAQLGALAAGEARTQTGKTAAMAVGTGLGLTAAVAAVVVAEVGAGSIVAPPIGLAICVALADIAFITAQFGDAFEIWQREDQAGARLAALNQLIDANQLRAAAAFGLTYADSVQFRIQPPRWGDAEIVTLQDGPLAGQPFSADAMLKYVAQPCWDAYRADASDHYANPTGRKHRDAARADFDRLESWCRVLGGSPWPDGKGSTYWGGWAPWNAWSDLLVMYSPPNEPAHAAKGATAGAVHQQEAAKSLAAKAKSAPVGASKSAPVQPTSSARAVTAVASGKTSGVSGTDNRNTGGTSGTSSGGSKPGSDSTKRGDA